jgi:Flp pilus assembly protein TadD
MHWLENLKNRLQPHTVTVLLLCIVTLAVYAPSLQHDFLTNWDDPYYITANEAVRGFTLPHISAAFSRFYAGNYAPVQILSYMLDYQIWGMRAAGFILTNIILHLANGLLFYRLLLSFAFSRVAAFVAALVFLMHPVQVESVAWISQRKNLLAMFFFLLAFTCYRLYAQRAPDGRRNIRLYLLSLVAFTATLLAKSVAVVLPVAMICHDFCYLPPGEAKKRLTDKVPYILLALIIGAVTIYAQQSDINNIQAGGVVPYHGGNLFNTFLTMMPVVLLYIKLLFLPLALSEVYPAQVKLAIDAEVICGFAALLAMIAVAVRLLRQRRDLAFWYTLIFICLAPVSQIIPLITLINDRYLYFPMLGVAALTGYYLSKLYQQPLSVGENGKAKIVGCIIVALLIVLPWLSLKRATVWQNSITLWNDTVEKAPTIDTMFAQADAYHGNKNLSRAKQLYSNILEKSPTHLKTLRNLAMIQMEENNFAAARAILLTLTEAHPDYAFGFVGLGSNYYMSGDSAQAETYYRKALAIQPESPEVFPLLGNILLAKRDLKEADFYLTKALPYSTKNPQLFYSLACLRSLEGNIPEALSYLESALKLGYRNKKSLTSNRELDNARTSPHFQLLLSRFL